MKCYFLFKVLTRCVESPLNQSKKAHIETHLTSYPLFGYLFLVKADGRFLCLGFAVLEHEMLSFRCAAIDWCPIFILLFSLLLDGEEEG